MLACFFPLEWVPNQYQYLKVKVRVYIPFTSQGHLSTGPQHCYLGDEINTKQTVDTIDLYIMLLISAIILLCIFQKVAY